MSRTPAKPATQMAFVTIDHCHFLMEASKVMKVVELMQHAAKADWEYTVSEGGSYAVRGPLDVEMRFVRADQVRMAEGGLAEMPAARPRLLR